MMDNQSLFAELVEIMDTIKPEYEKQKAAWKGSPFEWLLALPSRSIGAVGERLVHEWLIKRGFIVEKPKSGSDCDRLCYVQDNPQDNPKVVRLEIKFSRLWKDGKYAFQQIRDQEYDICFCLGISPQEAHAWTVPKDIIWTNATWQHNPQKAQDTKWVRIDPSNPPKWIQDYGGELEKAIQSLLRYLEGKASER
jgi:hypothetical protein